MAEHTGKQIVATELHTQHRCAAGICRNRGRWLCECGFILCGRCLNAHQKRWAKGLNEENRIHRERQRKLDSQPALLAACEELLAWANDGAKGRMLNALLEQARAAIKAARGEEWKEGSK